MKKEVFDLQNRIVTELLQAASYKSEITLKAPTGSGKTFIIADFMNRVVIQNSKIVFLVSSLSKAKLGVQNHEKFIEYSNKLKNINPFLISSKSTSQSKIVIPTNFNVYTLPTDLYKENSKLMEGAMVAFLLELKNNGYDIWVIRDECHRETTNLDSLSRYFSKKINVSATPQTTKFSIDVVLTEREAETNKLIKILENQSYEHPVDLQEQLEIFKNQTLPLFTKIQEEYTKHLGIKPCLIIQISNKDKGSNEWIQIKKIIENYDVNLHWMYIAQEGSEDNDTNDVIKKAPSSTWREFAKINNSSIDIIIFKMVITEGWDIPRACMLFQVRNTFSETLDEQVVGRVRRNPILVKWDDYSPEAQDLAIKYWLWGSINQSGRHFKRVSVRDEFNFKVQTTILQNLSKIKSFDFWSYVKSLGSFRLNTTSIFELHKKWDSILPETKQLAWRNIKNYSDWFETSFVIELVDKHNKSFISDYSKSMALGSDKPFPESSYFEVQGNTTDIEEWIWTNSKLTEDGFPDDSFDFDGIAEMNFAKFLKRLKLKTWGKNYYPNSEIKFEYFSGTIKTSYPDFILKDKQEKLHIFEVKSFDGKGENIDSSQYKNKINDLYNCYLHASTITNQIFYIPIYHNQTWNIFKFENGIESLLTLQDLTKQLSN
jgi:type III restriction enzyme